MANTDTGSAIDKPKNLEQKRVQTQPEDTRPNKGILVDNESLKPVNGYTKTR